MKIQQIFRGVACITVLAFSLNSICPAYALPVVDLIPPVPKSLSIQIPSELGKIERLNFAGSEAPCIIHIQSAHGNLDAQKKIKEILKYITHNSGHNLLALEGASSELHPEQCLFFPNDPQLNQKVTNELLKRSLLTGPEVFLIENFSSKNKALGIENPALYRENRKYFLEVHNNRKIIEVRLSRLHRMLDKISAQKLNPDLLTFVKRFYQVNEEVRLTPETLTYLENASGEKLIPDPREPQLFLSQIEYAKTKALNALAQRSDEKEVIALRADFILFSKLIRLELNHNEARHLLSKGINPNLIKISELDKSYETALGFYRAALKRDEILFRNTLNILKQSGVKQIILITGGFHADGISRLAKENSLTYLSVTPKISEFEKTNHYSIALRESVSGRFSAATLEQVLRTQYPEAQSIMDADPEFFKREVDKVFLQLGLDRRAKAASLGNDFSKENVDRAIAVLKRLNLGGTEVVNAQFSPDRKFLVVQTQDKIIKIIDLENKQEFFILIAAEVDSEADSIQHIEIIFSPNSDLVAFDVHKIDHIESETYYESVGEGDDRIEYEMTRKPEPVISRHGLVYHLKTGEKITEFSAVSNPNFGSLYQFSPKGSYLIIGCLAPIRSLYDINTRKNCSKDFGERIVGWHFSPTEEHVVVKHETGYTALYNIKKRARLMYNLDFARSEFSPNGQFFFTFKKNAAYSSSEPKLFDRKTGRDMQYRFKRGMNKGVFSPDGKILCALINDAPPVFYTLTADGFLASFASKEISLSNLKLGKAEDVEFSKQGRFAWINGEIVDLNDRQGYSQVFGHRIRPSSISPDEKFIFFREGNTAKLFDFSEDQFVNIFFGEEVINAKFSSDSKYLIVKYEHETKVFDLRTLQNLEAIIGRDIQKAIFSDDANALFVVYKDGSSKLFYLNAIVTNPIFRYALSYYKRIFPEIISILSSLIGDGTIKTFDSFRAFFDIVDILSSGQNGNRFPESYAAWKQVMAAIANKRFVFPLSAMSKQQIITFFNNHKDVRGASLGNAQKSDIAPLVMELNYDVLKQLLSGERDFRTNPKKEIVIFTVPNMKTLRDVKREYGILLLHRGVYLVEWKKKLSGTNKEEMKNLISRINSVVANLYYSEGKVGSIKPEQIIYASDEFRQDWGKDILRITYRPEQIAEEAVRSALLKTAIEALNRKQEWNFIFNHREEDNTYEILPQILESQVQAWRASQLYEQAA